MLRSLKICAVIATIFSFHPAVHKDSHLRKPINGCRVSVSAVLDKRINRKIMQKKVRQLAGPYAHMVMIAANKAHISPRLVAAVVQVENGGNFNGSQNRVSPAGAIGVMQLEPATAWDALHVNPWNPQQNIDGGARFLAMLLKQFHNNTRLALMAYNAGPAWIAAGGRPQAAAWYANKVMKFAM